MEVVVIIILTFGGRDKGSQSLLFISTESMNIYSTNQIILLFFTIIIIIKRNDTKKGVDLDAKSNKRLKWIAIFLMFFCPSNNNPASVALLNWEHIL